MDETRAENLRQAALDYHEFPKPGKLEIRATKPLANGRDLARAYSPGVAEACLEIKADPATVWSAILDPEVLKQVLSYQPEAGLMRHRQAGAQWLQRFGTSGQASRVMVTHGAQHGLACVLRTLARPGDTVLTESLSYPGLQALARRRR
mgnify:CR=1 FL=1